MKEATGELNMTVVTVVAIAALVGIFYVFIWPTIQLGMALSAACSASGGQAYDTTLSDGGKITCDGGTPNKCGYTPGENTRKVILGSGNRNCE